MGFGLHLNRLLRPGRESLALMMSRRASIQRRKCGDAGLVDSASGGRYYSGLES